MHSHDPRLRNVLEFPLSTASVLLSLQSLTDLMNAGLSWYLSTSALNETCTSSNDTLIRNCFDHGVCDTSDPSAVICQCNDFYDPESHCERNVFQILDSRILALPIVGFCVYIPFALLFLAEVLTDLSRSTKLLKSPSFWAKFYLLTFCCLRIWWNSFILKRALWQSIVSDAAEHMARGLGAAALIAGLLCISLYWLAILAGTKSLNYAKHLYRIRVVCFVQAVLSIPFIIILSILQAFQSKSEMLAHFYHLVVSLALLFAFLVTVILLHITRKWFHLHSEKSRHVRIPEWDSMVTTLRVKSINMVFQLVVLSLFFFNNLFTIGFGDNIPLRFIMFTVMARAYEMALAIGLYLHMQDYLFNKGFIIGYFRQIRINLRQKGNHGFEDSDSDDIMTTAPDEELGYDTAMKALAGRPHSNAK